MNFTKIKGYLSLLFTSYVIFILIRILETILIVKNYGYQQNLYQEELLGVANDLLFLNALFLVAFIPYYFLCRISQRLANGFFFSGIILLGIIHLLIVRYFIYQLQPLDVFLFQYTFKEIWFTITTSDISMVKIIAVATFIVGAMIFSYQLFKRLKFSHRFSRAAGYFSIVSILVLIILPDNQLGAGNFSRNKSFYFFNKSFTYFLNDNNRGMDEQTIAGFQTVAGGKDYVSAEFPLLHTFNSTLPHFKFTHFL